MLGEDLDVTGGARRSPGGVADGWVGGWEKKEEKEERDGMGGWMKCGPRGTCSRQKRTRSAEKTSALCPPSTQI